MTKAFTALTAALLSAPIAAPVLAQGQTGEDVDENIWVRDGFELTRAAQTEHQPRFMELGPDGTVYVSHPGPGQITALRDTDGDGSLDQATPFVTDQSTAHAMQWHDGWLYYTRTGSIHRARDTNGDHQADETEDVIPEGELVGGGGHWWRSLLIADLGEGNRIYTSIGDPGNITDINARDGDSQRRMKIWSFNMDGGDRQKFIGGIRNNEKLVLRPGSQEVWGMDHGSDWYGRPLGEGSGNQPITDRVPGEEMNHYEEGNFYGHPFIVDRGIPRLEYQDRDDILEMAEKTTVAEWLGGAHWAANSMEFYNADQFPSEYRGDAFVAYHGSWNRSIKHGYQVTRVLFEDGKPYGELPMVKFLSGPEEPGQRQVHGRPVDTLAAEDGSLLISDDHGRSVYRLTWVGDQGSSNGANNSSDSGEQE